MQNYVEEDGLKFYLWPRCTCDDCAPFGLSFHGVYIQHYEPVPCLLRGILCLAIFLLKSCMESRQMNNSDKVSFIRVDFKTSASNYRRLQAAYTIYIY